MNKQYTILGAGIAGIGAGYSIGKEAVIYEKNKTYGGLCNSFNINGYTFDTAIHVSFTKNKEVRKLFDQIKYNIITPNPINYYYRNWVEHPIQNNLHFLKDDEKFKVLMDFVHREQKQNPANYKEYLYSQYGKYIADNFMEKYTNKYWCTTTENMNIDWIGVRLYELSIDELLQSIFLNDVNSKYYAKEMRYPIQGGYKSFLSRMVNKCNIMYEKKVIEINTDNKYMVFSDNSKVYYDNLISSLPIPEMVKMMNNLPLEIKEAANKLSATSVILVSIGFKVRIEMDRLWSYIYDDDIPFCRMYFPHIKSINNVPNGTSSIQCEVYYNEKNGKVFDKNILGDLVCGKLVNMGICQWNDIQFVDIRVQEYANVVFDNDITVNREKVKQYLLSKGITLIGRFGEWDYLWSDQSLLSGMNIKNSLNKNV